MKPLPDKALIAATAVVALVTAVVVFVLWWPATRGLNGSELVAARFDALRIGLNIGVGSGAVIVLYLAWRRQRSTEDTLAHQVRVAESTDKDAAERRITDLYTKAADQLGSDKAPVRLAGLYALERLAQDNPLQRQTIVNVLCAYLRMPFDPPTDPPTLPIAAGSDHDQVEADSRGQPTAEVDIFWKIQRHRDLLADHRERVQEREVRLTAQRLLSSHSRPGHGGVDSSADTYWPGLELDLTGATLDEPDFRNCHLDTLSLTNARVGGDIWFDEVSFGGDVSFSGAEFDGGVWFSGAEFDGGVSFDGAKFGGVARFDNVEFSGDAVFDDVKFGGDAVFSEVKFGGVAWFGEARFGAGGRFSGAEFGGGVWFGGAEFGGGVSFDGAKFGDDVRFGEAKFGGVARFGEARFDGDVRFDEARFGGFTRFSGAEFGGGVWFGGAEFGGGVSFDGTRFGGDVRFGEAKFGGGVWFSRAEFHGDVRFVGVKFGGRVETDGTTFTNGIPRELAALQAAASVDQPIQDQFLTGDDGSHKDPPA